MSIILKNKHTLKIEEFYFRCCVGKGGLSKKKIEGDKKTPIGTFAIENLYFRKDRIKEVKKLGLKNTYLSLDVALKLNDYDAGIICSPTSFHLSQCINQNYLQ